MGDDAPEKYRLHIGIYEYQNDYLDAQNHNKAAVIREALDDWLVTQGVDPDRLETVGE